MRLPDVARLPVREVVSALHFKADLTLGLGNGGVRLFGEVTDRSAHSVVMHQRSSPVIHPSSPSLFEVGWIRGSSPRYDERV